ncbi:MAG: hypothetical protein AAFU71_02580 [Cyanobacteria bacterium J06632_22]
MNDRSSPNWHGLSQHRKQAANWCCEQCGKRCRLPQESLEAFIHRTRYDAAAVKAHPRRWTLTTANLDPDLQNPKAQLTALCGSCRRAYDNRCRCRLRYLKREQQGQMTLADIVVPLRGQQLALGELGLPYELVNALPRRR